MPPIGDKACVRMPCSASKFCTAVSEQGLQGAIGLQGAVKRLRQRLVQDQQVDLLDAELPGASSQGREPSRRIRSR